MTPLAPLIDHTVLRPDATVGDVARAAREALQYGFASVCVSTAHLPLVVSLLAGSSTKVMPIAVVGFPLGASTSKVKAFEAAEAVRLGALEIDMVLWIGGLKDRAYAAVGADIAEVVRAAQPHPVKVIIETALLTDEEKRTACALAIESGAAFVKTCTGFNGGGATVEDIRLMRAVVGPSFGVKASGGVRTAAQARALIDAGANRIGASASVAIVEGREPSGGEY